MYDLDAGQVTITLPLFDQHHYVYTVVYGAGNYGFSKEQVGTRYAMAAIRTLVDPNDPGDVKQVNALQDAVKVAGKDQDRTRGRIRSLSDWVGTVRRELLDQIPFWSARDLERKLLHFRAYYNRDRVHASLGLTPEAQATSTERRLLDLRKYRWECYCRGLYQLPAAA